MSLVHATVAQLVEWQTAIVHELARRSAQQAPVVAQPPWMAAPLPTDGAAQSWLPPVTAERPPLAVIHETPEAAAIREREAAARAAAQGVEPQVGRPLMHATQKTDPLAASYFASQPARSHDMQPRAGNGTGLGGVMDLTPAR